MSCNRSAMISNSLAGKVLWCSGRVSHIRIVCLAVPMNALGLLYWQTGPAGFIRFIGRNE